MPRNPGTGIYTLPPGTGGTPNQPISSTMFNTFTGDIANDLNTARPIPSGGTGATNAAQARTNLGLGTAAVLNTASANTWAGKQTFTGGIQVGATGVLFGSDDAITFNDTTNTYSLGSDGTGTAGSILETGKIRLVDTTDVSLSSTAHAFQIGPSNSANIRADGNEIMAVNNGATDTLFLNTDGGTVQIGPDGLSFHSSGVAPTLAALGLGTAATRNTGTSGATVPLLNGNNTWSGTQTFTGSGGIGFGSSAVSNGYDVSRHIALYGTSYGFSVTSSTLNYVSGSAHAWWAGSTQIAALNSSGTLTLNGGLTLGTALSLGNGGTGGATAAAARTNLGVAIGSDVQAYSSHLAALTSIAKTNGNFIVGNGTTWVSETPATARASMGLGGLATMDLADLLYTGSSVSNATFPVGSYVSVAGAPATNRNAVIDIWLSTDNSADFRGAAQGTKLVGTWRARGRTTNENYLAQRTA